MAFIIKPQLQNLTKRLVNQWLVSCGCHHGAVPNEPVYTYAPGSPERHTLETVLGEYQAAGPKEIPICIGDQELKSGQVREQVSPFDRKRVVARYYYASEAQIKESIASGLEARTKWERTPFEERAKIFMRAADMFATKRRPHLVATTMLGQAKTIHQAEIDAAAELIDFLRFNAHFAGELNKYKPLDSPGATNAMRYRGMEGFWGAVTPFNFTAIGGNLAAAPAIMGNVVQWKPTDTALLSNYEVYRVFREAGLPPNIINFIPSDGPTFGNTITAHPDLAGINFTGSVATFRYLLKKVGQNIDVYKSFPRLIGECGGKNYHFVHPSADPDVVAMCSIRSGFEYSGQKCSALSRMYVPQSLWPEIKKQMLDMQKQLKIDSPLVKETFTSAVIDDKAFARIKGYLEYAKKSSHLKVITGGSCDDSKGYFVEATIVESQDPLDKMMQEEIFGPIVTVYVYPDEKVSETLDLVKTTSPFGLTGAIFSRDENFTSATVEHLKDSAGNFYINNPSTGSVVGQQPFGGARLSGTNDKAGGPHYMLKFASPQSIKTQTGPITSWKQPHMG